MFVGGKWYGYGIVCFFEECFNEQLQIEEGFFYLVFYCLEKCGWIESEWGKFELGWCVKFY